MQARIDNIICYPLKGAGGFPLHETSLTKKGIAHDRRFGIAFGEESPAAAIADEKWKPWNHYHSLKKTAMLARLSVAVRDAGDGHVVLCINNGGESAEGNPAVAEECAVLESFLQSTLSDSRLRLIDSAARPLWDEDGVPLTLLNSGSVTALSDAEGKDLSASRFRANIVFSGVSAWLEETFSKEARIREVGLMLAGGVPRCAATTVNPETAERDANVPEILCRHRSHNRMGLFAKVVSGGDIAVGDEIHFDSAC